MRHEFTTAVAIAVALGGLASCSPDSATRPIASSQNALLNEADDDETLVVDNDKADCPNADFNSIQAAVLAAAPGTTILVCPGTYTENVRIETHAKDGLTLIGLGGPQKVILDGLLGTAAPTGYDGIVLRDVSDVDIRGFTVTGFHENVFLQTGADRNTIRHNVARGPSAHDGIRVDDADENLIEHNVIFGNGVPPRGCGVDLQLGAKNNVVRHNRIFGQDRAGVRLRGAGTGNIVIANQSEGNGNGILIETTAGSRVEHNRFEDNFAQGDQRGVGIRLLNTVSTPATPNVVRHNEIEGNQSDGIALENADGNLIERNQSDENGRDGIRADPLSAANTIRRNRMAKNGEHDAHDDSVGPGTAGTANFWLKNRCKTENRPGLCETRKNEDDSN
jgi:parallel beta-helix repeat protein